MHTPMLTKTTIAAGRRAEICRCRSEYFAGSGTHPTDTAVTNRGIEAKLFIVSNLRDDRARMPNNQWARQPCEGANARSVALVSAVNDDDGSGSELWMRRDQEAIKNKIGKDDKSVGSKEVLSQSKSKSGSKHSRARNKVVECSVTTVTPGYERRPCPFASWQPLFCARLLPRQ